MFRPVGSLPSSVYWRRRFALLGSLFALVVLLAITLNVVLSDGSGSSPGAGGPLAAGSSSGRTSSSPVTAASTGSRSSSAAALHTTAGSAHSSATSSHPGSSGASQSGRVTSPSSSAPPARCQVSALGLAAASDHSHYALNAQPVLSILVTNKGQQPCVQDLADPQIVLSVYNGEARVWGSHDCKIEPGTNDQTLMAGQTVRVSIPWSGLSSQKNCAGTRQRVGAGSYTLYATLAGRQATAAQFTIG